jgi:hypothetical protein
LAHHSALLSNQDSVPSVSSFELALCQSCSPAAYCNAGSFRTSTHFFLAHFLRSALPCNTEHRRSGVLMMRLRHVSREACGSPPVW